MLQDAIGKRSPVVPAPPDWSRPPLGPLPSGGGLELGKKFTQTGNSSEASASGCCWRWCAGLDESPLPPAWRVWWLQRCLPGGEGIVVHYQESISLTEGGALHEAPSATCWVHPVPRSKPRSCAMKHSLDSAFQSNILKWMMGPRCALCTAQRGGNV